MNNNVVIPGVGEVNQSTAQSTYGYKPIVPQAPSTINTQNIGNAQPYNLPAPISDPTAHNQLGVTGNNVVNNAINYQQQQPTAAANPYQETLDRILNINTQQATKGDFTAQAQQDQGLFAKQQALTDVNNEALTTQKSYADQAKAIQDNAGGLLSSGVQLQLNDLNRKKNEDLANIGIRQAVAQGNVQVAQNIIDQKVATKFQPLDDQLKSLQAYASVMNNDLTESQKIQAQNQLQILQQKREQNATAYQDVLKTLAQNQAPSAVQAAVDKAAADPNATPGSIYAAAGKFATSNQYQSVQSFDPTTGQPVYMAFDSKTGQFKSAYGGGSGSGSAPLGTSEKPSYEQYGLLSTTNFNPANAVDKQAYNYLTTYLSEGKVPNATDVGIKGYGAGATTQFNNTAQRARDLYFNAVHQPMPTPQIIANSIKLINTNNDLANKLQTQEQTVKSNIDLSLKNMTASGLNSSSFAPLNGLLDTVKATFNDPAVGQFLSQNATIQNELGSLLAVKNASGTTVFDKLQSAGIISSTDTPENIQRKVSTIIQEAGNFSSAIQNVNGALYQKIDPLQLNPDNPLRKSQVNVSTTGNQASSQITPQNVNINGLTVTVQGQGSLTFPNQAALMQFKKDHGL